MRSKKSIATILKEVSMFSSLADSELDALEHISHISEYAEGSSLFLQGEVSDSLMLLVDGVVSIFMIF
jgi:CRP-like cAMP-binding protein